VGYKKGHSWLIPCCTQTHYFHLEQDPRSALSTQMQNSGSHTSLPPVGGTCLIDTMHTELDVLFTELGRSEMVLEVVGSKPTMQSDNLDYWTTHATLEVRD
jgi:hypothetical protein